MNKETREPTEVPTVNLGTNWKAAADEIERRRYDPPEAFAVWLWSELHTSAAASNAWGMARRASDIGLAYDAVVRAQDRMNAAIDDLLAYLRREGPYLP